MFRNLQPLILASASPRRDELLRSVGLTFQVAPSGIEETGDLADTPIELVKRWARAKAEAVSGAYPDSWVLAADTIVVLEERIFGKPEDPVEAASMLRELSGRIHDVISGVCLSHYGRRFFRLDAVRTRVRFKHLTEKEILAYVGTGEPLDKAGAYGIQGTGAFLVQSINGSYTSVVGLPLCETLEWLLEQEVIAPASGPQDGE